MVSMKDLKAETKQPRQKLKKKKKKKKNQNILVINLPNDIKDLLLYN